MVVKGVKAMIWPEVAEGNGKVICEVMSHLPLPNWYSDSKDWGAQAGCGLRFFVGGRSCAPSGLAHAACGTHGLRPFDKLRASCGLQSCAASRLAFWTWLSLGGFRPAGLAHAVCGTHFLRPFDKLRASCGLQSCAASRLALWNRFCWGTIPT